MIRLNRVFSLLAAIAVLAAVYGCSEKKPLTDTAVKGNTVITALQDMSHMYERKNLPGFMNLVSDNYKDRRDFAKAIETVFAKYETVRFTVQYTKMLIMIDDHGAPRADFNWDSEWQTAGGSVQKNSGRVTFVFDPKDGKLSSIDGKSPFIPQQVEAPAKQ